MNFNLTEEQILLRDSIEKYVRDHCDVERHRRLINSELGFDPAAWAAYAELGWLCMPFSEEQGGFGGGAVDVMVMAEALAKGMICEPFLSTVVTCGSLLQTAANEEQQAVHLPPLMAGETQWAFAFAELGGGYDMTAVTTQAKTEGGRYVLTGHKLAVLNAHCANHLIVTANTEQGLSLFLVAAGHGGVTREPFTAVDGTHGAHLNFDNADAELLGAAGQAQDLIDKALQKTIVAMGAEALGAMQVLLTATVEYTKTREQFGQPIGKFQALQHRMADMFLKVEETRSLLLNAAILVDEGHLEAPQACAALKVKMAEAGRYVSQEAVQLHGGIGMTDELNVSHHFKRLQLLGMLYGDKEYFLEKYIELAA